MIKLRRSYHAVSFEDLIWNEVKFNQTKWLPGAYPPSVLQQLKEIVMNSSSLEGQVLNSASNRIHKVVTEHRGFRSQYMDTNTDVKTYGDLVNNSLVQLSKDYSCVVVTASTLKNAVDERIAETASQWLVDKIEETIGLLKPKRVTWSGRRVGLEKPEIGSETDSAIETLKALKQELRSYDVSKLIICAAKIKSALDIGEPCSDAVERAVPFDSVVQMNRAINPAEVMYAARFHQARYAGSSTRSYWPYFKNDHPMRVSEYEKITNSFDFALVLEEEADKIFERCYNNEEANNEVKSLVSQLEAIYVKILPAVLSSYYNMELITMANRINMLESEKQRMSSELMQINSRFASVEARLNNG
jgi:hypothetical protein